MAAERGNPGFIENNAARARNVAIVVGFLGLVSNPAWYAAWVVGLGAEKVRSNRQAARQGR